MPRTPYAGGVPQTPTTFYTSYDLDDPTGVDRAILQFVATGGAQATLKTRCLNGPAVDQVLAQEDAPTSATLWLLQDNLETVRNVVDNAGSVINDIEYDPYGNITSVTNPSAGGAATSLATDITYTGQLYDPDTGLYYFRHRWYDARTGTFTTQDPKGFAAGDANLYRYVGNSPTNDVDRVLPARLCELIGRSCYRCCPTPFWEGGRCVERRAGRFRQIWRGLRGGSPSGVAGVNSAREFPSRSGAGPWPCPLGMA